MNARETAINSAINDLNARIFLSQRAAAKEYKIPESTLRSRMKGRTNSQLSHQFQQRLTKEQEKMLVEWILDLDARGYPPFFHRAREMASQIMLMNGDQNPAGKLWLPHFIKRNPSITSVFGRKIEVTRANVATPERIRAFLELFESTRRRLNVQTANIWNMDETGVALG
ncbi:hypothetical protein K3495_g11735, partial [Podosphaera aphanis]